MDSPKKQLMTVGVVGAMRSEIDALISEIEEPATETVSGVDYVSGRYGGVRLVAARCGVGKVFAAVCVQTMILRYAPDVIVNIGVGGSLTPKLNIADICVASAAVQHDMDTTSVGDPPGMISGIKVVEFPTDEETRNGLLEAARSLGKNALSGVIASGDVFVSDSKRKKFVTDTFSALVCEMEGGAVAQTCYINGTPFCILRAVSDNGDENAPDTYGDALQRASDAALEVTRAWLRGGATAGSAQ